MFAINIWDYFLCHTVDSVPQVSKQTKTPLQERQLTNLQSNLVVSNSNNRLVFKDDGYFDFIGCWQLQL